MLLLGHRVQARDGDPPHPLVRVEGMVRYFAYGSNMDAAQMAQRVPGARAQGRARLPGYRLRCDKLGRDGSAKANVRVEQSQSVWGVIYEISPEDLLNLDRFEGGYRRAVAQVTLPSGSSVDCQIYIYIGAKTDPALRPNRRYRDTMVRGARQHGLPRECIDGLEALEISD